MTSRTLPEFEDPPVIEVVIGVQFAPLQVFSGAHAGWFWKQFLGDGWDSAVEVPRVQDAYEKFVDERQFMPPIGITFRGPRETERTQIMSSTTGRMIQIQDTRFILNWRMTTFAPIYPSFESLKGEFFDHLNSFGRFAEVAGTPNLELNQWEVVYVNHIPRGELWDSLKDWNNVLNFFAVPDAQASGLECETYAGHWSLVLPDNRGRLQISIQHGRADGGDGAEILVLQLTSRGPLSGEKSLHEDLELGHSAIVSTFTAMTTGTAHKIWGRTR